MKESNIMNLAQKLEECPPVSRHPLKHIDQRTLLKAVAPIDTSDPVDGILVEAGCTLGVVLTTLECMGADTHEGEASDVFTLLLALQRRLGVARKLRELPSKVAAESDADELVSDEGEGAPASSPRPSVTRSTDAAGDELQKALDSMHESIITLASMVAGSHASRAMRLRTSADSAYADAMHARSQLLAAESG